MFKNYGDTETELKAKIQDLFEKAQKKWEGVFPEGARIELTPSHLAVCVASLEKVKLFNSNLEVVDDVRIPRDGGHDSMLMADSVPA